MSDLLRELLFYLVVLLTHTIQGITGFAGTILAMPFSLKLVGMDVAVPVLNMLGLVSGIYVTAGSYKHIERGELKRILLVMGSCVLIGLGLRSMLSGKPQLLYYILGVSILAIAVHGIWGMLRGRKQADSGVKTAQAGNEPSMEKNGANPPYKPVGASISRFNVFPPPSKIPQKRESTFPTGCVTLISFLRRKYFPFVSPPAFK